MLGCAAILAGLLASRARPAARDYLRFAAVLYSPLALCEGLEAGVPDAAILVFADAVMLVVSAEEGVKPQTEEHLAICSLLGVCRGLTVITKADAVSPGRLEEVRSEIGSFLSGTFLDPSHAVILPVSAQSGQGLEQVRRELLSLAMKAAACFQ